MPAQPSGLGTRPAYAKALKARSIGLASEAYVDGSLVDVERSICARRFRKLGRAVGAWGCFWGPYPRLLWAGPLHTARHESETTSSFFRLSLPGTLGQHPLGYYRSR